MDQPILRLENACVRFGDRTLWSGLDLELSAGELVAVLGPNGAGKTTLMRAILGVQPLTEGRIELLGEPVRRGHPAIGYLPQQRFADRSIPIRARDLVALSCQGTRFGFPLPDRSVRRRVDDALAATGVTHLATAPVGILSGGEQQRVRIAQALVSEPRLLLCDEPLSALDLPNQQAVSQLIDDSRKTGDRAALMITHDINPVLGAVDRVIYLAGGRALVGPVDEVLRTDVLTRLYGSPVEVLRVRGRIVVVGVPEDPHGHLAADDHHPDADAEALVKGAAQ